MLNKFKELPYDKRLNEMLFTLYQCLTGCLDPDGLTTTASAKTLGLKDSVLLESGNVGVTIPQASAENKGKAYLIRYSGATISNDLEDDDGETVIAHANITQHDLILLVSTGDPTSSPSGGTVTFGWNRIWLVGTQATNA